jgi:hypothetical protein
MKKLIPLALLLTMIAAAQQKPSEQPKAEESKPVPEAVKFKVLAAWHKARQYQDEAAYIKDQVCQSVVQCKQAQDKAQAAVNDYNAGLPVWTKEAGLPEGSQIVVDERTDAVTAAKK